MHFHRSLLLLLISPTVVLAQLNPLIISPSLNSDGSEIAFSYQGDIWKASADGGRTTRLTIHEGYETFPPHSRVRRKETTLMHEDQLQKKHYYVNVGSRPAAA